MQPTLSDLFFENVPVDLHAVSESIIRCVSNTLYKFHPCYDAVTDETG